MLAEGMVGIDHLGHPNKELLTSDLWGSYFYYARSPPINTRVAAAVNFRNLSASVTGSSSGTCAGARPSSTSLKRVSSMKSTSDYTHEDGAVAAVATTVTTTGTEVQAPGPKRINTLWGTQVRDHARMCIPDLNVLIDYPIDFRFPAFGWTKRGELTCSGFFPADPKSLHQGESSAASAGGRGRRLSGKRPI